MLKNFLFNSWFKFAPRNNALLTTGSRYKGLPLRRFSRYNSVGPDSEIVYDLQALREVCRENYFNNPIAKAAVDIYVNFVVGKGMRVQPVIDIETLAEKLKLGRDEAEKMSVYYTRVLKKYFDKWAESKTADVQRQKTFNELQQLALKTQLHSGEVFGIINHERVAGKIKTSIGLIEPDRVESPTQFSTESNIDGLILDQRYGRPVKLLVKRSQENLWDTDYKAVSFYYPGGRPKILHIFESDRPGQHRGTPILAPIVGTLQEISTMMKNEIKAGEVNSFIAAVMTSSSPNSMESLSSQMNAGTGEQPDNLLPEVRLENGTIMNLMDYEKLESFKVDRPNVNTMEFIDRAIKFIGMGLDIPYEVFQMNFSSSFSASRGALNLFKKPLDRKKQNFEISFCAPVYREVITDAVISGDLELPGFIDDEQIREAWLGSTWSGTPLGQIDDVKEVQGARDRIALGISTAEEEAAALTGNDYDAVIEQLAREKRKREALGIMSSIDIDVKEVTNDSNDEPDGELQLASRKAV